MEKPTQSSFGWVITVEGVRDGVRLIDVSFPPLISGRQADAYRNSAGFQGSLRDGLGTVTSMTSHLLKLQFPRQTLLHLTQPQTVFLILKLDPTLPTPRGRVASNKSDPNLSQTLPSLLDPFLASILI
jgi:hypothetical protein